MKKIGDIIEKNRKKLRFFELELIIANTLGKPREFVLAHPEYKVTSNQQSTIRRMIKRRIKNEPIAYIIGHKEFYGIDFIVNKHTLIPRPETELLVDEVISIQQSAINKNKNLPTIIIDVGTGSGNIIISAACNIKRTEKNKNIKYYAIDISKDALKIARKNAQIYKLNKKINFFQGDLLTPILKEFIYSIFHVSCSMIIVANLPYLSKKIYSSTQTDVKKYEPKSALYSPKQGLQHYKKLLIQIKKILSPVNYMPEILYKNIKKSLLSVILEISPEQKNNIAKIIKNIFPKAKLFFRKDLNGKWRVCSIKIY